jgi:hypothetical protein
MKVIGQRVYNEPAAFIGLLVSLALLALALLTDADWDASTIAGIIAPLVSALGIRQAVYSPATVDKLTAPAPPPVATTYQKVPK